MSDENRNKTAELINKEFKVLDHGFIRLIDYMGNDEAIVQAARVSYGAGTKKISEDRGLIRYLMRHRHTSPFEMVEFKFHVKLPIFVARQWIRHRSANVNEYSGRYSVMKDEFYLPPMDEIRLQSVDNKQGRSEEDVPTELKEKLIEYLKLSQKDAYKNYKEFIDAGIAREIARINLPLSLYTEWYWKLDLHNLFHFLKLRMDKHAQKEFRLYAQVIAEIVKTICPIAFESFMDFTVNSCTFSGVEMQVIADKLRNSDWDLNELVDKGLSKREAREFLSKFSNSSED